MGEIIIKSYPVGRIRNKEVTDKIEELSKIQTVGVVLTEYDAPLITKNMDNVYFCRAKYGEFESTINEFASSKRVDCVIAYLPSVDTTKIFPDVDIYVFQGVKYSN